MEGERLAEDKGLDTVTEGDGAEGVPVAPAGRTFSIPRGVRALQVSGLDFNPMLGSDYIRDQISRVFAGTGVHLTHIENDCFNLVRKPGRLGGMTLVENALAQLAEQHPRMVVMGVGAGPAVEIE